MTWVEGSQNGPGGKKGQAQELWEARWEGSLLCEVVSSLSVSGIRGLYCPGEGEPGLHTSQSTHLFPGRGGSGQPGAPWL